MPDTWADFNASIKECQDEKHLERLLKSLVKNGGPLNRIIRVHGRLTKVRSHRERKELIQAAERAAA